MPALADATHLDRRRTIHEALIEMSDETLMEEFQRGTLEAFNIIVDRYSERLMRYLSSFQKDARSCEDLLQETFIRVYRNRHAYKRIASFSTWIYTVAGNLARSEYRRMKRGIRVSINPTNREGESYDYLLNDESFMPDRETDGILLDNYIQNAINALDPVFREVVVLRDVQQLKYEEIADITGLPLGTVKSRINRGRGRMQKMLEDVYPFEQN